MNEMRIFDNPEFGEIRTVVIDGQPWFVGADVAKALGYKKPTGAVTNNVDEGVSLREGISDVNGHKQTAIVINESGLYTLIFGSKLESAKNFKKWVTSEILPSVRKHGMYAVDELLENPDITIKAFTALKEEREKNKKLTEDNNRMKPKEIFADAVTSSHTSILIGELAKLLKQNGIETGQKRLFNYLRKNGYLIRQKGIDYNMPPQRSMQTGLFEIKESTSVNPDGSIRTNKTTKITGKGKQYFINKFLKGVA